MKILTNTLIATSLALFASSAFAGQDSGLYAGGSIAYSSYEVLDDGEKLDDSDASYKLFGGYNFGLVPFFDLAAELSYYDFGSVTVDTGSDSDGGKYSSSGLSASALGAFNIGPVGLFLKYGFVKFDGDVSDSNEPAYGVGARFQLGSLALRAEYELFDLNNAVDVDYASIGASWTF